MHCSALVTHTGADNVAMLRTLRRFGVTDRGERDGTVLSLTLPVAGNRPANEETPATSG
jgi:hypothetical protein